MTWGKPLSGRTILVVEDNFLHADDVRMALERAGARVVGPVPDTARGIAALEEHRPDCAFLDINLGSGISFETAKAAARLGVRFVFLTGYEGTSIAPEFDHIERLQKPVAEKDLITALVKTLETGA